MSKDSGVENKDSDVEVSKDSGVEREKGSSVEGERLWCRGELILKCRGV